MAERIEVTGELSDDRDRVTVLTLDYDRDLLLKEDAPGRLSEQLIGEYRRVQDRHKPPTSSAVVNFKAKEAGSPVVRALFDLWKEVIGNRGGQVVCVNYPADYIDSLTALGLPALPGFSLASSVADAVRRVSTT